MNDRQSTEIFKQIKSKSESLKIQIEKIKLQNKSKTKILKNYIDSINTINQQTQIQTRKNKSLIVLVAELHRQYHQIYLQSKSIEQNQTHLINHNNILRSLLIKQAEKVNDIKQLHQFLKQLLKVKNKSVEYLNKTQFIENQVQLIVKLRSKVYQLNNPNYQCRRKWVDLQKETSKIESSLKSLKIQLQRQKTQIKECYEDYLQKVNESKTKFVYFNQTQNTKTISEHLVKEMALLQERRKQVEQQKLNLLYHHQNLREELARIKIQNKQLKQFFTRDVQESRLAAKMKTRIEQLKDTLIQENKKNNSLRLVNLTNTLQTLRKQHQAKTQSNDYLTIRLKQEANGFFQIDDKDIVNFFSKVCQGKDQHISILKDQDEALVDKIRQLKNKKQLIQNQILSLEEGLDLHSAQQNYKQSALQRQIISQPNFKKEYYQ